MHAERVDGYDPLAVADAVARKKKILLEGRGPVLLDTITYRVSGHSPSDASSYRTKDEVELWQKADSIDDFAAYLIEHKVTTKSEVEAIRAAFDEKLTAVIRLATNESECPRVDGAFIESVMFSNGKVEKFDDREPELLESFSGNARVKSIAGKVRKAFDAEGKPVAVEQRERHFAHQLIEEFMIAANEAVSEFLQAHALPCLYRVHAEPDREKLENLYTLLSRLDGEAAPKRAQAGRFTDDDFTPEAIGRMLASVAGTEREFLVHRLVLRSMKQARYQPDNEGHFGLASESYAHFTSPIRRYADLIVHRLIKRALGDQSLPVPAFKKLAEMGQHLSGRERVSQEAERECHKRYACMVLRAHVGEEFRGVVSGLLEYGFWVELPDVMAEGFIRLATMPDDYYGYLKEREMLLGERSGRIIRVGQAVRTKLLGVHLDRLEIDLQLITDTAEGPAGEAMPFADRRDRRALEEQRRADQARSSRKGRGAGERTGKVAGKVKGQGGGRPAGGKPGGKPGPKSGAKRRAR